MNRKRAFISLDYDNDSDLRMLLVGQSRHPDTPFDIGDFSIKEASVDWIDRARARIRGCDVVIVICGKYTNAAFGVGTELRIAQNDRVPYFLLWGRSTEICVKPNTALSTDMIYRWTWDNLKALIHGAR